MHCDPPGSIGSDPGFGFDRRNAALGIGRRQTGTGRHHLGEILAVIGRQAGAGAIISGGKEAPRRIAIDSEVAASREHAGPFRR